MGDWAIFWGINCFLTIKSIVYKLFLGALLCLKKVQTQDLDSRRHLLDFSSPYGSPCTISFSAVFAV